MSDDRRRRPFDAIRAALSDPTGHVDGDPEVDLRLDLSRQARTGIPEVVLAEHKTDDQVRVALVRLATANGRALAARCRPGTMAALADTLADGWAVSIDTVARTVAIANPGHCQARGGGRIAIIAAGTSDLPVASEARVMASEMDCHVVAINDVGVAGLHRLVIPLERVMIDGCHVIVVAAGMDGALPSVVAGLVDVPVIGLPTSIGYGHGGHGEAALATMLQSCSPGLVVVNIDNGIGAGATAALIANAVAAAPLH